MEPDPSPVEAALRTWQDALVDLRASNPLLNLDGEHDVIRLVQPAPDALFRSLRADPPAELRLVPAATIDQTGVAVAAPGRKPVPDLLRAMWQQATTARLEQGIHLLYLTFGTLRWESSEGSLLLSPLLLLPVQLARENRTTHYELKPAGPHPAPQINPALCLKLDRDCRLQLRSAYENGAATTLAEAVERVREKVAGQRQWLTDETVYLGLFRSSNYVLFEDLQRRADDCRSHPLIRALAGEPGASASLPRARGRTVEELEETEDLIENYQVLDADASQREAIDAVNQGTSVVIQGPPGTGKSQTIANIIAEALGRGRKVLFVSEKMAALRVVAQRLEAVGLGPFCLQLHEQGANPAVIVTELDRTIAQDGAICQPDEANAIPPKVRADLARLRELRHTLNAYLGALCDRNTPLGRSAYEIMGEIAALASASILQFDYESSLMGKLTQERLAVLTGTLEDFLHAPDTLLRPEANPWAKTQIALTGHDPVNRLALKERLQSLASAIDDLETFQQDLRRDWGLPAGASLADAVWLQQLFQDIADQRGPAPLAEWFATAMYRQLDATARIYAAGDGEVDTLRASLLERYTAPGIFAPAMLDTLTQALDTAQPVLATRADAPASHGPGVPIAAQICAGIMLGELSELAAVANRFAYAIGSRAPQTVQECEILKDLGRLVASGHRLMRAWCANDKIGELEPLVTEAQGHAAALAHKPALAARFKPAFFEHAADDARFERLQDTAITSQILAHLHADILELERTAYGSEDLDRQEAVELMSQARAIRAAEAWFAEQSARLDIELDHYFTGPAADWPAILDAVRHVKAALACDLIESGRPPSGLVDAVPVLARDPRALADYEHRLTQVRSAWAMLLTTLPAAPHPPKPLESQALPELEDYLRNLMFSDTGLIEPAKALVACRRQPWAKFEELPNDFRAARRVLDLESELSRHFGSWYRPAATDWHAIVFAFAWVSRIRGHFERQGEPPEPFTRRLAASPVADKGEPIRLGELIGKVRFQLERLSSFFLPDSELRQPQTEMLPLAKLVTWLRELLAALPRLDEWIAYRQGLERAANLELSPFVKAVQAAKLSSERWADAFRLQLLTLWLGWRQKQVPELGQFFLPDVEQEVAEFRQLDRAQPANAARHLAAKLNGERAAAMAALEATGEMAALRQAAHASGERRPLRQLFEDMPKLLPALKPCMLMSPTAVAQYLGESPIVFDLVVFDEASQLTPAEAISAIVRGKQIVVVGDSQQMPPTSFFQASVATDQLAPVSLLEAAITAGLPERSLRWHYRSRHQDLIAFSNRHFYRDELVTFPSPRRDLDPVEFVYVADGVYGEKGNTNPREAAKLVDLVAEQVTKDPAKTIGAVAFSKEQMLAIQEEIDRRAHVDLALERALRQGEPDGFLVWNLETVQGDERDAIFLSVGYGPNRDGKMIMNFGPLNFDGGKRRLNVAITRARERMVVVASFPPERLSGVTTAGPSLLRDYLVFARSGPGDAPRLAPPPERPSPEFARAVAAALRQAGLTVVTDVGAGGYRLDMAIQDDASDQFLVAIECDGSAYLASPSARDRERLRQQILSGDDETVMGGLGWPVVHRIWSAAWLNDPAGEIERVKDALAKARAKLAAATVPPATAPRPAVPVAPPPAAPAPAPAPAGPSDAGPVPAKPAAPPESVVTVPPGPSETAPEPVPVGSALGGGDGDGGLTDGGADLNDGKFDVLLQDGSAAPPTPPAAAPTTELRPPAVRPQDQGHAGEPARPPRADGHKAPAPEKSGYRVSEIKGVPPKILAQLREQGIHDVAQLLAATDTPKQREALAKALGVEPKELTAWVQRADLMRLTGVGTEFSDLLALAKVPSCKVLQHRKADNLYKTLKEAADRLGRRAPSPEEVAAWIAEAKELAGGAGAAG